MATDFTQDSVLKFLQSRGGSVKNSDLLLYFRTFLRDHVDRDRNRDLFKKFVNSVATVKQEQGVSYVIVRKKFRGHVPGGGGAGSSGRNTEKTPENTDLNPAASREQAPLKPQLTPAPLGQPDTKTILPAAGIMLNNNNNNVETNFNLKQQQQLISTSKLSARPAAVQGVNHTQVPELKTPGLPQSPELKTPNLPQSPELKTPNLPQPPARDQRSKVPELKTPGLPQSPELKTPNLPQSPELKTPGLPQSPELKTPNLPQSPELKTPSLPQSPARDQRSKVPELKTPGLPQSPELKTPNLPQSPELKTPSLPQSPARDQRSKVPELKTPGLPQSPELKTPNLPQSPELKTPSLPQSPARDQRSKVPELKTPNLQQSPARDQRSKVPELKTPGLPQSPELKTPNLPQSPELKTPNLPQPPARDQRSKVPELKTPGLPQPPAWDQRSKVPELKTPGLPQPPARDQRSKVVSHTQVPQKNELKTPGLPQSPARDQRSKVGQNRAGLGPPPGITPVVAAVSATSQQVPETLRGKEASPQPEGGLHQDPALHHVSLHPQVAPRRTRYRQSYKSAVSYDEDEEEEEEVPMRRGPAGGAWPLSIPLGHSERVISTSSPCIIEPPAPSSVISSSSSSERKPPKIYIQDVDGETLPLRGPGWSLGSGAELRGQWAGPGLEPGSVPGDMMSTRRSLPLEAEQYMPSPDRAEEVALHRNIHPDRRYSQPAGVQLEARQGSSQSQTASSPSSIFSPSSDTSFSSDWPSDSPRGSAWKSSYEDLQARAGETVKIQEVLQRAQATKLESVTHHADSKTTTAWHHSTGHLHNDQQLTARVLPLHHSTDNFHDIQQSTPYVLPWHSSTGDLYDNVEGAESSEGSISSPPVRLRPPVARRLSSKLRSRMCRSLGADLDQLLEGDTRGGGGGNEAARLNRLHLISSSLSLHYNLSSSSLSSCSTPPRCHSLADLAEGGEVRGGRRSLPAITSSSGAPHEGPSRQSLVPLEPKEHVWLVKGAAGAWPDIYSLFREDSSLLNRRDFISGFTVLHWIAKHGDHRVLNTLWYGVQKAGLTFDINARSSCGHTPLHIAAIHSNKNIMRLLVKNFNADVRLRDTAGKRPWQYLSRTAQPDIFQLLGAPARASLGEEAGVGRIDHSFEQQQHRRRRRRHHLSSASSGGRPLTVAGMTKVKRSSSIAAFLKNKSLRYLHGHQSDSSV